MRYNRRNNWHKDILPQEEGHMPTLIVTFGNRSAMTSILTRMIQGIFFGYSVHAPFFLLREAKVFRCTFVMPFLLPCPLLGCLCLSLAGICYSIFLSCFFPVLYYRQKIDGGNCSMTFSYPINRMTGTMIYSFLSNGYRTRSRTAGWVLIQCLSNAKSRALSNGIS